MYFYDLLLHPLHSPAAKEDARKKNSTKQKDERFHLALDHAEHSPHAYSPRSPGLKAKKKKRQEKKPKNRQTDTPI